MSDVESWSPEDAHYMRLALRLARRGQGRVEPNPLVGAVLVREGHIIATGYHRRFGGPHAEVEALRRAGDEARGATLYVNLEPCCHFGKTPPCTEALLAAGVRDIHCAMRDPFAEVDGGGIQQLLAAGANVRVGLLADDAKSLNAPYLTLLKLGRPWVIAKWAMSWDGRIATRTGDSRWISNQASRRFVHRLRGRVDAIVVGRRTAEIDDPLLTARPTRTRVARRIVLDSQAKLSLESQLVRTAHDVPIIVAVGTDAPESRYKPLADAGCEILRCSGTDQTERVRTLLAELGKRRFTNILVEGGGETLGSFRDADVIDEVHVFLGALLVGGIQATSPMEGLGAECISDALALKSIRVAKRDGDIHLWGRVAHKSATGYDQEI